MDEDTLAEWVEGEVIMTSPASLQHQLIASFLSAVMGIYAQRRQLGVVTGPVSYTHLDVYKRQIRRL